MMDKKVSRIANDLFNKAHSQLDAPLIGEFYAPVCLSCINYQRGKGLNLSTCKVFGNIPDEFIHCKSVDCPNYDLIPDCPIYKLPKIKKAK